MLTALTFERAFDMAKHPNSSFIAAPAPLYLDDEAARSTMFGGLAASGWHTAAITMRLQVSSGLPIAGGIVGAGGELTWPRPTRATDVLHVVSEVLQVQHSKSKSDEQRCFHVRAAHPHVAQNMNEIRL